jgi:hypothetical protein
MYRAIDSHPKLYDLYKKTMLADKVVSEKEAATLWE